MNLGTMEAPKVKDFRLFLQQEYIRRCRGNSRYSLRSYARNLGVEPSALSKILHGKRRVTKNMLNRLGNAIGIAPQELRIFESAIIRKRNRLQIESIDDRFNQLALDSFQVISDWYHYAILELISINGFKPDAGWVSHKLGIGVSEVKIALERLGRLQLLEIKEDGSWVNKSGNNTTVGNEFSALAFRTLQKQVLEMAIQALETIPMEERDQSSMTMAIDTKLLPEAKVMIRKFRRQLCKLLQSNKSPDQVYQLGISLYPLTNKS